MKYTIAALAVVSALALAVSPAFAGPFDSFPGSHVGHLSLTDHPDVPNCTVLGPNAPGCETVLVFPASSSTGSGNACHNPPTGGHYLICGRT